MPSNVVLDLQISLLRPVQHQLKYSAPDAIETGEARVSFAQFEQGWDDLSSFERCSFGRPKTF